MDHPTVVTTLNSTLSWGHTMASLPDPGLAGVEKTGPCIRGDPWHGATSLCTALHGEGAGPCELRQLTALGPALLLCRQGCRRPRPQNVDRGPRRGVRGWAEMKHSRGEHWAQKAEVHFQPDL